MSKTFEKYAIQLYTNFMLFTISNPVYNFVLALIENIPVLYIIDFMFDDNILSQIFTPFYFLSPHLYLDLLNQKFPNECNQIFQFNTGKGSSSVINSFKNFTNNTDETQIIFFKNVLLSTQNSFCVYSSSLCYIASVMIVLVIVFLICLMAINARGRVNFMLKIIGYLLVNIINLFMRSFSILLFIILINRPILILYKGDLISADNMSLETGITILSVSMFIISIVLCYLNIKFINNSFHFESLPYDYFSTGDAKMLLVIKILIGFKINFDKLNGLNVMSFISLIIGIFIIIRLVLSISNRNYLVNHLYLKNCSTFFSLFYAFYIIIKLLNQSLPHLQNHTYLTLVLELILIFVILIVIISNLFRSHSKFIFRNKSDFMLESLKFLYYVGNHLAAQSGYKENKTKRDNFIDNVIIGHKMKCRMEDCIICCEDIYNPDLKTLLMILYQQFLKYEKEFKEENEGLALLIKLIYLKALDDRKIHRIAFVILKNIKSSKLSLSTYLKYSYIYEKLLDELNHDLRNLLQIKYGEIYDEMLKCIGNFEDILGFIKSKTEKVELVTKKTNLIGDMFNQLTLDLFFLKKNKRIYFDPANLLQIICIIRLVFHKNIDVELTENLEYNFTDFLEIVDRVFGENISFFVRYDFTNRTWRIKKIPKKFIDQTNFKVSDLLDQSIEKIFPHYLAKNIVQKLEDEIILANIQDQKLEFKTVVCDSETNARYVKFIVDIIPSLENNYILLMHCHFHRRQLLIIDEFGNFVNGSRVLYEKVGINADIVAASKGRINMFTMFNLDKKQKLEDVKIVSVASEGIVEATRKLFLLETGGGKNPTQAPEYLQTFLQNEATGGLKKEKNIVFLHLFYTEVINDVKYFIYNLKLSSQDDKRRQNEIEEATMLNKPEDTGKGTPTHKTVTIKRLDTNFSNSSEDRRLFNSPTLKNNKDKKGKDEDSRKEEKDNINTYQNYLEYYNCFYDTHRSVSMTVDYKTNLNSFGSSQNNSTNSDVFSYLYLKTISSKIRSNKFETFLYGIFIFNISLVVFGLINIIYIHTCSLSSFEFLTVMSLYHRVSSRIYTSTCNFFSILKYSSDEAENGYSEYINRNIMKGIASGVDYDQLIKISLGYQSDQILADLNNFDSCAYKLFGESAYQTWINYHSPFIHLDASGSYMIKSEDMKVILNLFALASNEIANRNEMKIAFNLSFLEYTYANDTSHSMQLIAVNTSALTSEEKYEFRDLVNLYQYFFNYFNSFYSTLGQTCNYILSYGYTNFDSLQTNAKALLIVIVIFQILFVLVCLFSILIYKKILTKEFNTLYNINEEHITKLKEKYQYVKELIKWEQYPSKIYNKLKKLKEEVELANLENSKRKLDKNASNSPRKKLTKNDDNISVMTTGSASTASDYLRFSGAMRGLFRSATLKAQERMEKMSKETKKQKVSLYLLKRLNFDFEMIKNLINFIAFMSLFYLVIGILLIYILEEKYEDVKLTLKYTNMFETKSSLLYNYYIGVKLSIMFNKMSPYTLYGSEYNPDCVDCNSKLFTEFSNVTAETSKMEMNTPTFSQVYESELLFQGSRLCEILYSYDQVMLAYLEEKDPGAISGMTSICKHIPILQSNIDSIFTNMIVYTRQVYNLFLSSDRSPSTRIVFLRDSFKETDLLFSLFSQPYYDYVNDSLVKPLNTSVMSAYYSFLIAIFTVNIFLDIVMILFIWFKIYKQIINSVINVQLVTDSVSNV